MAIIVQMPALSPTMSEGTLARWHVAVGDHVAAGDVIAEIETDKATMEVEAVDEGAVARLLVDAGTEGVAVNQPIAVLLEEGEDAAVIETLDLGTPQPTPSADTATPPAEPAVTSGADITEAVAAMADKAGETKKEGSRLFASPLARRMAGQAGLDLNQITGSGPHGRIVKADIEHALANGTAHTATAATDKAPGGTGSPVTPQSYGDRLPPVEVELTGVQKVIARRLTEADRDVPQFYLTIDCAIDALLAVRKDINAAADGAYKLSVNDLILKAAATALRKVPEVNAQWADDKILRLQTVDIAVAVAYDGGLITPIVTDVDRKGAAQISQDMKDLAGRARDGKLKPEEYQGGGFTVSNLGMFGIKQFTSIINPPSACILAVGAGEPRAIVVDGAVITATMMTVTLTCDHRVVDGALGARWLQAFKTAIEKPATMIA